MTEHHNPDGLDVGWWGQDPDVDICPHPGCGCPVQGGPLGMTKHQTIVHPTTTEGTR